MQDFGGWEWTDKGFFSATDQLPSGRKRHRVVERMPEGGWDWSVWTSGGAESAMYGREETLSEAMDRAERAAAAGWQDEVMLQSRPGLQPACACTM